MKISAVAVTTTNIEKTIAFYSIIGFDFSNVDKEEDHIEPKTPKGSARLMIDTVEFIKEHLGEIPKSSNISSFAIQFTKPEDLDKVVESLESNNFKVVKKPWDAFWGQRYAIVEDPDGYKVDLYSNIKTLP